MSGTGLSAGLNTMASQNRQSNNQPYLIPIMPFRAPKREQTDRLGARSKKIYIIPWESSGEKPLINYILVPDELLSPSAPLDTLDDERRFEPKKTRRVVVTHHTREKVPSSHHHSPHQRTHRRKEERVPKKSSKYVRAHESGVKHFRSVQTGGSHEDVPNYEESANE